MAFLLDRTVAPQSATTAPPDWRGPARSAPSGPPLVWVLALGVTALAAWLVIVGARTLYQAHDLFHALIVAQERTIGPVLIAIVLLVLLAERRWPVVRRPMLARPHIRLPGEDRQDNQRCNHVPILSEDGGRRLASRKLDALGSFHQGLPSVLFQAMARPTSSPQPPTSALRTISSRPDEMDRSRRL